MSKILASRRSGTLHSRMQVEMAFPQSSHGRILPMEEPGFLQRLLRRR